MMPIPPLAIIRDGLRPGFRVTKPRTGSPTGRMVEPMTMLDNTGSISGSQPDVVDVLLAQHTLVRELITEVSGTRGEPRQRAFDELRTLLALHEAAEESIVHPAAHGEVGDARVAEEQHAAQAIAQLESLDPSSEAFDQAFAKFAQAVLTHADKEEREEFPALRQATPARMLQEMADRVVSGQEQAYAHMGGDDLAFGAGKNAEPFSTRLDEASTAMDSR